MKNLVCSIWGEWYYVRKSAKLEKHEFAQLLGKRGIPRHYGRDELEDDMSYARSE